MSVGTSDCCFCPLAETSCSHRPGPMNKTTLQVWGRACVAFRKVSWPRGLVCVCVCLCWLHLHHCCKAVCDERTKASLALPWLPPRGVSQHCPHNPVRF